MSIEKEIMRSNF